MADLPNAGFGPLPFTLSAFRARRARAAGDLAAYSAHALDAIRRALAADGDPEGAANLVDCTPVGRTKGGYFSCLVTRTDGSRSFVKCIPKHSREMRFWEMRAKGGIGTGGQYYRILPPDRLISGAYFALLIFPALPPSRGLHRRRTSRYTGNIEAVVRAIADFNSDYVGERLPDLALSPQGRAHFVPSRRRIAATLGVDRLEARRIAQSLRRIEGKWTALRRDLYRGPLCLSHMDFGPGNVLIGPEPPFILDFGHAGITPVGADLHTILRYARKGGEPVDWPHLVEIYAKVFEAKGIEVDRTAIARAAELHFASRYRDLRLQSARDVFGEALAVSTRLASARP